MNTLPTPIEKYEDARGGIYNFSNSLPTTSILKITCKEGAIRANHWHKEDYHFCVLSKGDMYYYERPLGSQEKPTKVYIQAGQAFYTPPMVEHAMEFLSDSEFWCFSKLSREQQDYETDTTRLSFDLTKQ